MTSTPGNTIRVAKAQAEHAIQQILQALALGTGATITGISVETYRKHGDAQDHVAAVKIDLTI